MGYLLGGLMWFCIPFTLATTLGLSALALDLPISIAESNAGAAIFDCQSTQNLDPLATFRSRIHAGALSHCNCSQG